MPRPPWIALLGGCLLVLASPLAAQSSEGTIGVDDVRVQDPIAPLEEARTVLFSVDVPCEEDEEAIAWTKARLIDAPSYMHLDAASVTNETAQACTDGRATLGVPGDLAFDRSAPAFEPVTGTVQVDVQLNHTGGEVEPLGQAKANLTATPGYFNLYNAHVSESTLTAGPQEAAQYVITIENFSNALTLFEFSLPDDGVLPSGFEPVVPEPLILPPAVGRGQPSSETITFTVHTPFYNGYVNEHVAIQLEIESAYAQDTSFEGEGTVISMLTHAKGLYVPGPAGFAIAALAAAASARRRVSS